MFRCSGVGGSGCRVQVFRCLGQHTRPKVDRPTMEWPKMSLAQIGQNAKLGWPKSATTGPGGDQDFALCFPFPTLFFQNFFQSCEVFRMLRAELWQHARIQTHQGKTQVWNRGPVAPNNINILQQAARLEDPDALVWRRDGNIPSADQGVVILGPHWDTLTLCRSICNRSSIPAGSCWNESLLSQICNPLG